jgi:hypothetical protein
VYRSRKRYPEKLRLVEFYDNENKTLRLKKTFSSTKQKNIFSRPKK